MIRLISFRKTWLLGVLVLCNYHYCNYDDLVVFKFLTLIQSSRVPHRRPTITTAYAWEVQLGSALFTSSASNSIGESLSPFSTLPVKHEEYEKEIQVVVESSTSDCPNSFLLRNTTILHQQQELLLCTFREQDRIRRNSIQPKQSQVCETYMFG